VWTRPDSSWLHMAVGFAAQQVYPPGVGRDHTLRCAECHRRPRPDENPDDEWRVYSDGIGELHTFCPECARREFAPDAPASGLAPATPSPAKLVATRRNGR
jgi:hypothetical protein